MTEFRLTQCPPQSKHSVNVPGNGKPINAFIKSDSYTIAIVPSAASTLVLFQVVLSTPGNLDDRSRWPRPRGDRASNSRARSFPCGCAVRWLVAPRGSALGPDASRVVLSQTESPAPAAEPADGGRNRRGADFHTSKPSGGAAAPGRREA